MQDEEKGRLIVLTRDKFEGGMISSEELLRTKMELEILEAQVAAAKAEERAAIAAEIAANASVKNARYVLYSVYAAAISAIVAMISTAIAVFGHH
jgi:PHD/YefM family antitoxin component YafN of YafNO toxin-antitoxin module